MTTAAESLRDRHQTVVILDFGSQFTQLIARRVREQGVYCEIHPFDLPLEEIRRRSPIGVVLSGGPQSVYADTGFGIDPELFQDGIPVLGICYGLQLMAHVLGGEVIGGNSREYGRAEVNVTRHEGLFAGVSDAEVVWMSHGDHVESCPPGFEVTASTASVPVVGMQDPERQLYGIQFHPEVSHTASGSAMLRNFLYEICGARGDWAMSSFLDEAIEEVRVRTAGRNTLCAISGGVDSSVVAVLLKKALGDRVTAVFVDNGLLRKGEGEQVLNDLRDRLGLPVRIVRAQDRFLNALAGVEDPEQKRKIIGKIFIDVFAAEAAELEDMHFLAQGTLYPDVIESATEHGAAQVIKTHHNVGGLPERLGFELVEPLRMLFKDEVRQLGRELGLPDDFIGRHPFPGPGLAVRILGEVTAERADLLREADAIFLEELRGADLYDQVSQAFAVLLPVRSVGVMGDYRTYENVVALRSVDTRDFMTADWSHLPHELLGHVANRIVNEVSGVNRVVYDITSKPPATIEWE